MRSPSSTIFTAKNLRIAYYNCRKTKRKTINALKYELDLEDNLNNLKIDLVNRSYQPGQSICFVVTVPKPREIFAADFRDRIVHHVLINQVEQIWEQQVFIEDSYACRIGKGHHFAARRFAKFVSTYAYYGQFDIQSFFSSIHKPTLYNCFSQVILNQKKPDLWKNEVLWLAKTIIFNRLFLRSLLCGQ